MYVIKKREDQDERSGKLDHIRAHKLVVQMVCSRCQDGAWDERRDAGVRRLKIRSIIYILFSFLPAGIGQITAVTDPAELFWEHMHEKPADELFSIKRHGFYFTSVIVVFVSQRNTCFYRDDPAI